MKFLILDLDHTLLDSDYFENNKLSSEYLKKITSKLDKIIYLKSIQNYTVLRDDVWYFLRRCNILFDGVAIWSAGSTDYVKEIREKLEKYMPFNFIECLTITDTVLINNYIVKDLKKIYKKNPKMTEKNTVIIDDTPSTFILNKKNSLLIDEFKLINEKDIYKTDVKLKKIVDFFDCSEFLSCKDVKNFDLSRWSKI